MAPKSAQSAGSGPVFKLRSKLDISQADAARLLKCSVAAVRHWERTGTAPVSKAVSANFAFLETKKKP
jgi:DNA-binding transcriptional regulator YiaG